MMVLRRGEHTVIALTDADMMQLADGKVLAVPGGVFNGPVQILCGGTHAEMQAELDEAGLFNPHSHAGEPPPPEGN